MDALLRDIRACRHCEAHLPHQPRPVIQASSQSRLVILGQAPGSHVHKSGVPWDDPSGRTLRSWLGITDEDFYNPKLVAHMPMGFCYPGKAKNGDLPPRPECAPLWHTNVLGHMSQLQLKLVIGGYAQKRYIPSFKTVTDTVKRWRELGPDLIPLPHPSPLNRRWLKVNPWFEEEVVPMLRERVRGCLES